MNSNTISTLIPDPNPNKVFEVYEDDTSFFVVPHRISPHRTTPHHYYHEPANTAML